MFFSFQWCKSGVCIPRPVFKATQSPVQNQIKTEKNEKLVQLEEGQDLESNNVVPRKPIWTEWGDGSECESGCLYGESGRLKEGSTGLRIYQRSCGDYG